MRVCRSAPSGAITIMLGGVFAACLILAAVPSGARAQAPASEVHASPELAPDHWAVIAARRAEALGLVDGYLPAQRSVPRHVVARVLGEATSRASEDAPRYAELAHGWQRRFREEFPGLAGAENASGFRSYGQSATIGYLGHRGRYAPGRGVFPDSRTGADPLPGVSELRGTASLTAGLTPFLSALAEPGIGPDGLWWQGWDLSAGWRQVALSVGRQPVGYGYGWGGGVVLSGDEPITRVQFQTQAPFRLPGLLGRLGLISVHAFGGWLEEPRHAGDPYLWGAAGTLQFHPRATLSIHRASIIGGDSVITPLTPRTFLRTFIGHNLLGFENEVVAAQLRLRLPTDGVVPLTIYTEWGAEDAAGAWRDVPGRLYGVFVPAIPGVPTAALGVEYASFGESCCGNPPWYRHHPHTGGWVVDERPMGHPLGGQGRQATLYSQLDLLQSRLWLDGQLFSRRREGENLYVPGHEGASTGVEGRARLRIHRRGKVVVGGLHEAGEGWREQALSIGFRTFF
jgi:hypothetical protein